MTDAGAYSDIVFGLFRLLGLRFSPRLADMGGANSGVLIHWLIMESSMYLQKVV